MVNKLTKLQIQEVCKKYKKGISANKLGQEYNVSGVAILGLLKRRGINARDSSHARQVYSFNESYFDNIDTEEKAYWLGFIFADGHVTKKNELSITLGIKDKNHLIKLKKSLNSTHPVKECNYDYDTHKSYFRIKNTHLGTTLKQYDKNLFPNIKKELTPHFIRGLFDGDGSIYTSKNKYSENGNHSVTLIGEKAIIETIQNILISERGLSETKLFKRHKERDGNTISWIYSGRNNIKKIYDYLYKNANIYLERKKEIFEKIESERPTSQVRRCSFVGCDKKHFGLGLCRNHYYKEYGIVKRKERYKKYGK